MSKSAIRWFKTAFHEKLADAVENTPFDIDLLCAIAYQETGYVWRKYTSSHSVEEILTICVGDTIDYPRRKAFPRSREALEEYEPKGKQMFKIARKALLHVARYEAGYQGVAKKPHKFCRGYGIFQYDLQFFKEDPDYFLEKKWENFDECLAKCIEELVAAKRRQGWSSKTTLTRDEKIHVAIAYNRGKSNVGKGFKQGYYSGGKYYGEWVDSYYETSGTIEVVPVVSADPATPHPVAVADELYRVRVNSFLSLRERSTKFSAELARLPAGQIVINYPDDGRDEWWRVETNLVGTVYRGYVYSGYLQKVASFPETVSTEPEPINFKEVPAYIRAEIDYPSKKPEYGMKSKSVEQVQEWLCLHYLDTAVDGDFGPATKRMVRRFQERKGLNISGNITHDTWKKLTEPMREALAEPEGIDAMTLPEAVLAVAKQHTVLREIRPFEVGGDNSGPWVRLYCGGKDGQNWLWCAGFVSFLLKQAAFYREETPLIDGSVSCDTLASQGSAAGRFVSRGSVTDGEFPTSDFGGCAIFLQRRVPGDWNHTGLAFNFSGSGSGIVFDTIEGNTNPGGSRNGGEARTGARSMSGRHYDFITLT